MTKALDNNFWVTNINSDPGFNAEHILQFLTLLEKIDHVHINPNEADSITWNLSNDGCYSSNLAYKAQFLSLTTSNMPRMVWKPWAPPKCKIFTWLVLQDRIWTADRLERRGWDNCGWCKLCDQVQESVAHLLFHCNFSTQIWTGVKTWLGMTDIHPADWSIFPKVKDWWTEVIHGRSQHGKALASMAMLISWEI